MRFVIFIIKKKIS